MQRAEHSRTIQFKQDKQIMYKNFERRNACVLNVVRGVVLILCSDKVLIETEFKCFSRGVKVILRNFEPWSDY